MVHLDLWSGVPTSTSGYVAVLVLTDRATRYCMGIPLRNKKADTVAQAFINHWVKYFAVPEGIMTDGGPEFKGVWEEITKLLKIQHFVTTPYHPQANGLVESKNKMMIQILEKHCNDKQRQWDKYVPMAVLEYNCVENTTTKETPYFLVFGMEPRTPLEIVFKILPFEAATNSKNWREDFLRTLHDGLKRAGDNIQAQQKLNAERWMSKVRVREFKPGDKVMIRKLRRTVADKEIHRKLSTRWKGPFTIMETPISLKNCYNVEVITKKGEKKITVVNIKNIKKFHDRPHWMQGDSAELEDDSLFLEERGHLEDVAMDNPQIDVEDRPTEASMPKSSAEASNIAPGLQSDTSTLPMELVDPEQHSLKDIVEVSPGLTDDLQTVDVSIVMNGIRSWWCAKVISTEVMKGKRRLRVKPVAKLPPRWAGEKQVRPCSHNPQVASPC